MLYKCTTKSCKNSMPSLNYTKKQASNHPCSIYCLMHYTLRQYYFPNLLKADLTQSGLNGFLMHYCPVLIISSHAHHKQVHSIRMQTNRSPIRLLQLPLKRIKSQEKFDILIISKRCLLSKRIEITAFRKESVLFRSVLLMSRDYVSLILRL